MAIATNSFNYSTTATSTYTVKSNPSDVFVTATAPAVIKLGTGELGINESICCSSRYYMR